MMMVAWGVLADATTSQPSGAAGGVGDLLHSPLIPFALVMVVLFWFMSSSKRKQERKKQELLNSMKRGDRVQTIGGILGTVVEVRDGDVVLKVDEGNNTKIKFSRNAIAHVVNEEAAAEAK